MALASANGRTQLETAIPVGHRDGKARRMSCKTSGAGADS